MGSTKKGRTTATKDIAGLGDLTQDPKNARQHNDRNLGAIEDSLREVGAGRSIVVDERGVILAGNATVKAAQAAGIDKVHVVRTDGRTLVVVQREGLTDAQKTRLALSDNRAAELAEWNLDVLAELHATDPGLLDGLWTGEELAALIDVDGPAAPVAEVNDDVPPPPRSTDIVPGDLFALGDHRLLCGNSTFEANVARLMGGVVADVCFTSPPYALGASIKLSGNTSLNTKESAYDEHEDAGADWPALMDGWWRASEPHAASWLVNVQLLAANKRALIDWLHLRNNRLVDVAVWDKGHGAPAMAAGVLAARHEWLVVLGAEGAKRTIPFSSWRGTIQSVYEGPPQRANEFADVHGATMPVHLPLWALGELCDRSATVYEPFSGTGTTMMAAEQLGKRCFGLELSPLYVAVAIERWERHTNRKAVKLT